MTEMTKIPPEMKANLGYATTEHLIAELDARVSVHAVLGEITLSTLARAQGTLAELHDLLEEHLDYATVSEDDG